MAEIATIRMGEVMSGLTLHVRVTGVNTTKVRMWLGAQCLKLAALIIGCGIVVSLDD